MKNINKLFLLCTLSITLFTTISCTIAIQSTQDKACQGPKFTPTTIKITNNLGSGQTLGFACQSLDDHTGSHDIGHGQSYEFQVKPALDGVLTQYFCQLNWGEKSIAGATFYNERIDVQRCCGNVPWVANKDGVVGLSTHSKDPPITYTWSYEHTIGGS